MRRKSSRILQLQELHSLNATRKRKPVQSWSDYLAEHADLAARLRSTRNDKDSAAANSGVNAQPKDTHHEHQQ